MKRPVLVSDKKNFIIPFFILAVILALLVAGYFYFQYQKTKDLLKNPNTIASNEVKEITLKVGQLIELPEGEEPTVATVSDKDKLKDQPFFARAANGDKVLIYTKAKKAILYRPSTNKIIEVAPVSLGNTTTTPKASESASPTKAQSLKVVLYNGTTTVGLTATVEKDLKTKMPGVTIIDRDNASRSDYEGTIVIDLKNNPTEAKKLADAVNGEVAQLPTGEKEPSDADFLVILGK